jgi:hypothetical protein
MPQIKIASAVLGAILVMFGAGRAPAQDFMGAQTPSHNIFCQISPAGDGQPTPEVRCDIQQMSSKPPRAPRDCPLSWGDAFVLDPSGPGRLLCHGDTVANPSDPVIPYGTQWGAYGLVCNSQTTGLTCVNRQGHGFMVSRAVQRTF